MLPVALQHRGADPSFAIGSEPHESRSNARIGTGDISVVEPAESDGAFLQLAPVAGIVTNVEPDHLDHWGTYAAIEDAYVVSVSALNDRQEPIWNEGVFDVRSVRRYVQFRSCSRVLELEAGSNPIAGWAEGQTGRLFFSGTRLVSFVPNVEPERAPWIS